MPEPSLSSPNDAAFIVRPTQFAERISFVAFWAIHWGCLAAIWTGVTWRAAVICIVLYWARMFGITAGYHRYFSHRTYKTSRAFQLFLAVLGTLSIQKGPLWWAANHRHHHKFSDLPEDIHSPRQRGFWYSHVQWITSGDHITTDLRAVKDLAKYPELHWLGKWHWVPPLILGILCYVIAGWSGFVVGMGWSTVLVWHWTFTINSLSHVFGRVRYATGDDSKNNWFLAFFTMGEGWHNNHHHYQYSANQGFFWWEFDFSYYILKALSWVGIVWELRKPPARALVVTPIEPAVAGAAVGPISMPLPPEELASFPAEAT